MLKRTLLFLIVILSIPLVTLVFLYSTETNFTTNLSTTDDTAVGSTISLEDKVGQLVMIGHWSDTVTSETTSAIKDLNLGGVIVMDAPGDGGRIRGWSGEWQTVAGARPLLIGIDQEGGVVSRIKDPTFPLTAQPNIISTEDAYRIASVRAQGLTALGINANFSPVLDQSVNPEAFMYDRVFRAPEMTAPLGDAMIRGYQNNDLTAVPKHYPGHPDSADDSHLTLPVLTMTPTAYQQHTEVFKEVLEAGNVEVLMTAHVLVPSIDSTYPATLSSVLIDDLRQRIGYQGVILTDDLAMQAISDNWSYEEAAVLALQAGADMIMLAAEPEVASSTISAIVTAVESDSLSAARVDEAYSRVTKLKQQLK